MSKNGYVMSLLSLENLECYVMLKKTPKLTNTVTNMMTEAERSRCD